MFRPGYANKTRRIYIFYLATSLDSEGMDATTARRVRAAWKSTLGSLHVPLKLVLIALALQTLNSVSPYNLSKSEFLELKAGSSHER